MVLLLLMLRLRLVYDLVLILFDDIIGRFLGMMLVVIGMVILLRIERRWVLIIMGVLIGVLMCRWRIGQL